MGDGAECGPGEAFSSLSLVSDDVAVDGKALSFAQASARRIRLISWLLFGVLAVAYFLVLNSPLPSQVRFLLMEAIYCTPVALTVVLSLRSRALAEGTERSFWGYLAAANAILLACEILLIVWVFALNPSGPPRVSWPFHLMHGMAAFCCASIGVRASLKSPTSLKAMGGALATIVFAASIAPLIVSGIFQTIYLTPFSLPTLVWMVHGFFMTIFADFWQSTSRHVPSEFVGLCFTGGIAFCGYLALTWGAYRSAIDRFDEFAGRVIPRSRVLPATIGPPRSAEASSGSGDTIHYG